LPRLTRGRAAAPFSVFAPPATRVADYGRNGHAQRVGVVEARIILSEVKEQIEIIQVEPSRPLWICEAKVLAMIDLRDVGALTVTLPFLEAETLDIMAIMESDFWRYGVHENMAVIAALTGDAYKRCLIEGSLLPEELFAPSMFELSKV
jgi:hypothetical protein